MFVFHGFKKNKCIKNTSNGDAADDVVFSDNSKETVFEFLESDELTYLRWGNSIQKTNRLWLIKLG